MKLRILIAGFAAALTLSCAATKPSVGNVGGVIVLPVKASVFVRATFDSDPSSLIGAFIPDSVDDSALDESQAARTRCSDFIRVKKVASTGEVEEVFGASAGVGGKLGVKGVAFLSGERSNTNALRIKYNALEKMTADVDTKGLYECCQAAPDQCSKRYIASSLSGDGRIYAATETSDKVGLEAEGTAKGIPIAGDIMYKDGVKWERTTEFKNQYFSFSIARVGVDKVAAGLANDCSWARKVPKSIDGQYFVGVSEPSASERLGRDLAMREARSQVVKYLGEWLDQSSKTNQKLSGAIGAIGGELDDVTTVETLSQGIAKMVKDEAWCDPEKQDTPKGQYQVVKVLAFFPNSERAAALRVQMTNLIEILKAKKQLTPEREAALRAAITEVK
jgi:hypothetical protein